MKTLLIFILLALTCSAAPPLFFAQNGARSVNTGKSPLEISVTCLQFLRAEKLRENGVADGAGVGASGSTVWEDEAGSYDATQGTVAARPTLIYNAYKGKACVRFDGAGDSLNNSGVASKACWAVLNITTIAPTITYVAGSAFNGGFWVDQNGSVPREGPGWWNGSSLLRSANSSNRISAGSLRTIVWTDTKVFIDGVEVTGYQYTNTVTGNTVQSIGITTAFPAYWPFDLVEIAHFNGTPTSTDIANLQAYAEYTYK